MGRPVPGRPVGLSGVTTLEFLAEARRVGMQRSAENIAAGRKDLRISKRHSSIHIDIVGAFGEMVLSEITGLPVAHKTGGPRKKPDVGGMEVKTTSLPDGDLLIPVRLAKRYPPSQIFVLIRAAPPRYQVMGWAFGHQFIGPAFTPRSDLPFPAYEMKAKDLNPWPPPIFMPKEPS